MDSINDEKLNEAINGGKTTLVWFSAEWCGPCKILKPKIENEPVSDLRGMEEQSASPSQDESPHQTNQRAEIEHL